MSVGLQSILILPSVAESPFPTIILKGTQDHRGLFLFTPLGTDIDTLHDA